MKPKALFGFRVFWGLVRIILTKPKSPLTFKNMFDTRVFSEFNPRLSPLFSKF
jgi:hypothetical protein